MKIDPLAMPAAQVGGPPEAAATDEKPKPGAVAGKGPIDPEKLRLAKEFEEIFIRKMLSSLEKSGHAEGKPSGGDAYGSMVVSAMAQAVSQGGGVGLAEMIARSATEQATLQDVTQAHGSAVKTGAPNPASSPLPTDALPRGSPAPAPVGPTYARPSPTQLINENEEIGLLFKGAKP